MKRETVTTIIEAAGVGFVVGGISSIYTPAGWIACGLSLIGMSWLASR